MSLTQEFLNALELQNKGKVGTHIRPHKPAMILAVLDMIALHGRNQFAFDDELIHHFEAYFRLVQEGNDQCTPENPFWHLNTAQDGLGIWDHVVHETAAEEYRTKAEHRKSGLSRKWIRETIDHAELDPRWFSLFQSVEARNSIRHAIAHRYFPNHATELIALCYEIELPLLHGSPFAPLDMGQVILQNEFAVAFYDRFPVSEGHALVVPKRVVPSVYDLPKDWQSQMWNAVRDVRSTLGDWFSPDAYNIGINDGAAAGQTINHAHIHIIPRYQGDQPDPRGGIRWIFPNKAEYWNHES